MKSTIKFLHGADMLELICPTLLLTFTCSIFGPFQIYITNISELFFSIGDIWWICALAALISFLLLTLVGVLLKGKLREWYCCGLWGAALGFYIQGNFVVTDYGTLDGTIDWEQFKVVGVWNTVLWIICLAVPFILHSLIPNIWKSVSKYLSFGIVMVQIITLCTLFMITEDGRSTECQLTNFGRFELSEHENTIVFVLDAYDSQYFSDFIAAYPEYKETLFSGFTFYPNTIGGGIRTTLAMPQILTGRNYTDEFPYPEYLENAYQTTNVYRSLYENGYNIGIYTAGNFMSPSMNGLIMNIDGDRKTVSSYTALAYYLYRFTACRYFPHELKQMVWMYSGDFDAAADNSGDGQSPYLTNDSLFYSALVEERITLQEENAFRLYHLFGTHQPYTLDAQAKRNIEGTSLEEQQLGTMLILETYFGQMKELGIYDNANIIILADHGEIDYGQNPLLMVKRGQETDSFQVSNLPVSYINLHPTFLSLIGEQGGGAKSIFELTYEDNQERFFYVNSSEPANTATEYAALGHASDSSMIHETGRKFNVFSTSSKGPTPYKLGTTLYFDARATGSQYIMGGFSSVETTHTWTDGHEAVISIPLQNAIKKDAFVSISLESVVGSAQRIKIYINNQFLNDYWASSKEFSFIIPKEMLEGSKLLDIRFELPDAAAPGDGEDRVLSLSFQSMVVRERQEGDEESSDYHIGNQIVFTEESDGRRYFLSGVSGVEVDFSWSLGKSSEISLHVGDVETNLRGEFQFKYIHAAPQRLIIRSRDKVLYDAVVNSAEEAASFSIPAECIQNGWLILDLEYPDAVSPASLGQSEDRRVLAFGFSSIQLYEDGAE